MAFRRLLANLFGSRRTSRGVAYGVKPHERRSSDEWRQEFEVEKELRRGMRGD